MVGVDGIAAGFFEEFASSTDDEGTGCFEAHFFFFCHLLLYLGCFEEAVSVSEPLFGGLV